MRRFLLPIVLAGCAASSPPPPATPPAPPPAPTVAPPAGTAATPVPKKNWIATSNEHAKVLIAITAKFSPESAAQMGVDGIDEEIVDLQPKHRERQREALKQAKAELEKRMAAETDPFVKQDIAILVHAADVQIRASQTFEDNLVPYENLSDLVLESALGLLDDQIPEARRKTFVARLRKYAGMDGRTPIADLVKAEIQEALKPGAKKLVAPTKIELERHLANNATIREGVEKLLRKYDIKNWEEPHGLLMKQLAAYDDFIKTTLLPKARAGFALPPAVYAIRLEEVGVDLPPAELTVIAHDGFKAIQNEMKTVAADVAKSKNLPNSDYREVIKALKKEQLGNDAILGHYKSRLAEVEAIIKKEKLATLPSRPARIRLGTPAENAQMPAPHMTPPRMIGNTGEQGEFILPLEVPLKGPAGATKLDDFTFAAASWTLTAHEARPGHEMQFTAMVERGLSNARAIYAANSANIEGWGLYSEAIIYPFMPPEGKLISLQLRLQRAARAFLDPELQQGKWTFDTAKAFLQKEVGLSPALANSEVERYTFRSPGQATSYYYGFLKLQDLRKEVETKLGAKFDAQKFHDVVLAQGLLPPNLMRTAVLEELR